VSWRCTRLYWGFPDGMPALEQLVQVLSILVSLSYATISTLLRLVRESA